MHRNSAACDRQRTLVQPSALRSSGLPISTCVMRSTPILMPPGKSPALKSWQYLSLDDDLRERVGERAFQAVTHLDAYLALAGHDDQERAVVPFLLANLPVSLELIAVIGDQSSPVATPA